MTFTEIQETIRETDRLLGLPTEKYFKAFACMPAAAKQAQERAHRCQPSIIGGNLVYASPPPRRQPAPVEPRPTPLQDEATPARNRIAEIERTIKSSGRMVGGQIDEMNRLDKEVQNHDKDKLQKERAWDRLSPAEKTATLEWDNDSTIRATARDKETYVYARAAELDGTSRTYIRQGVETTV